MKREILFRGRSLRFEKFVFGNLVYSGFNTFIVYNASESDYRYSFDDTFTPIDKKTLGQYSNYKDQNKSKIFEGDICQDKFKRVMVCKWWNGRLQWFCSDLKNNFRYADLFQWLKKGKGFSRNETILSVEIIGNMTDNPRLFKKSNK